MADKFKTYKCDCNDVVRAKLDEKRELKLNNIKKQFKTSIDSPYALVLQKDGIEVVVHKHGDLLFKNSQDKEKINQLAKEIYHHG